MALSVDDIAARSQVVALMDVRDADLIALTPVKERIRDIAALQVIDQLLANDGLDWQALSLHMNFTGNPGTGKRTVAIRTAQILPRLGHVRKGLVVSVTRDALVGQYIGRNAPKTKEVVKRATGGALFINEAYGYRPENQRDDFGAGARETFDESLGMHLKQPHFANARRVSNALDRVWLRRASRLVAQRERPLIRDDLTTLLASNIRASPCSRRHPRPQAQPLPTDRAESRPCH